MRGRAVRGFTERFCNRNRIGVKLWSGHGLDDAQNRLGAQIVGAAETGPRPRRWPPVNSSTRCNLDNPSAVCIACLITAGGREARWRDRTCARPGAGRQEAGPKGERSAVRRGCPARGQGGGEKGAGRLGTSKEHPRNMLATMVRLWWCHGATTALPPALCLPLNLAPGPLRRLWSSHPRSPPDPGSQAQAPEPRPAKPPCRA